MYSKQTVAEKWNNVHERRQEIAQHSSQEPPYLRWCRKRLLRTKPLPPVDLT